MTTIKALNKQTYAVQHNPNCPSPFLVRLIGPGSVIIDYKGYGETKDVLGFGKTLNQAAKKALSLQKQRIKDANARREAIDIRSFAKSRCRRKHPDLYDSMICVGPGSEKGFGPPCDDCINEALREHKKNKRKIRKS